MSTPLPTEIAYTGNQPAGVIVSPFLTPPVNNLLTVSPSFKTPLGTRCL